MPSDMPQASRSTSFKYVMKTRSEEYIFEIIESYNFCSKILIPIYMEIKNWEQQQKWLQKRNKNFCLEPMLDRDKENEKNNRLKDWKEENQKATIAAQKSITRNRWRVLGTILIH